MRTAGLVVAAAVLVSACAGRCARQGPRAPQDMVAISGGDFFMGSDSADANENEKPVHPVRVAAFLLDRTEVTVAAYAECVRAGACRAPEAFLDERGNYRVFCNWQHPQGRDRHPVNCVDFYQARSFCAWTQKRLPTEEEWEFAARDGDGRVFPWGNESPDATRLNACGPDCSRNLVARRFPGVSPMYATDDAWPETAPVGSFPAGATTSGLLDVAGNVWEWTASEYATYDGKVHQPKRVLRGGSWGGGDPGTERTTNRFRLDPESRGQFLGFRCAR
jgi:formylglycine-generating enzyme required for sulfatase activity